MFYGSTQLLKRAAGTCLAVALLLGSAGLAVAQYREDLPPTGPLLPVENPTILEKTGTMLPLDAAFTRSDGQKVHLSDEFSDGKPVILSLVYYSCPSLCGFNQQALVDAVLSGPRNLKLGADYRIVVVSIDPDDTPADSAKKKELYQAKIGLGPTAPGFTYLTGTESNIQALADAVGFGFKRNPYPKGGDKFLHSTGIFVVTPEGRLSQTILGITYEPDTLHLALVDASHGKLGRGMLNLALCCGAMHFNPNTGRYENNPWFYAGTAGGLLTIACVGVFLAIMWRGEMRGRPVGDTGEETDESATGDASEATRDPAAGGGNDVNDPERTSPGRSGL